MSFHSEILTSSAEQSIEEYHFAVACEGKMNLLEQSVDKINEASEQHVKEGQTIVLCEDKIDLINLPEQSIDGIAGTECRETPICRSPYRQIKNNNEGTSKTKDEFIETKCREIKVRIFDSYLSSNEYKNIYENCDVFFNLSKLRSEKLIFGFGCASASTKSLNLPSPATDFFLEQSTEKIKLTSEDDYTHAIIINLATPVLKIPKENVLGLALEPPKFLNITPEFINYAIQNIGTYYIGQLSPKLSIYPLFKQHYMYLNFNLPSQAMANWNSSTLCSDEKIKFGEGVYETNSDFSKKNNRKDKIMSLIVSQKLWTNGQRYRHVLASEILKTNLPIDIYGRGCYLHTENSLVNSPVLIENQSGVLYNIKTPLRFTLDKQLTSLSEEKLNLPLLNMSNSFLSGIQFGKDNVEIQNEKCIKDDRLKGNFNCEEPYEGYKFHICIENFLLEDYFSEKIINPLVSNIIPIYLGSTKITEYFPKGASLENSNFSTISSDEKMNLLETTCKKNEKEMIIQLTGDVKRDMELITHICNNVEYYEKKIHKNVEYVKDKVSLYKELERLFLCKS
jgi:hypothetical protein